MGRDDFAQGQARNLFGVSQTPKGTLKVVELKIPFMSNKCPISFGYQKSKTVFKWPTKEEEFILDTSFGLSEANCELYGPD